jgi:hypothetical protein
MTRLLISTAILAILATPALTQYRPDYESQATKDAYDSRIITKNAHEPLPEDAKERLIAANLKTCLKQHDTAGFRRTYSPSEMNNFCSCQAVKNAEMVTLEDWQVANEAGDWPKEWQKTARAEVGKYCRKYLNVPDVKQIKDRKW